MKTISSLVEDVLKKYSDTSLEVLTRNLSSTLEFRLLFNIDFGQPFRIAKKEFIKNYFIDLLTLNLGNVSRVAEAANLNRRHVHRLLNELDINPGIQRKEMLKPYYYLKENIQQIFENVPDQFKNASDQKKIEDVSEIFANNTEDTLSYEEAMQIFEKEYIQKALEEHDFDILETADSIKLSERTLYRKINKLSIAVA